MTDKLDLVLEIVRETRDDVKEVREEVYTQNGRLLVVEQKIKLQSRIGAAVAIMLPPIAVALYFLIGKLL